MDYKKFFSLQDAPFRLTPDPDYFFPSDAHREAFQTLLYSIRAGEGFVQITGEPGTGKTLLLRTILRELGSEVTTALILNPRLSPQDLLIVILEDLGSDPVQIENKTKEKLLRSFRDYLLEQARQDIKTVVIIDEAQNLPNDTLEELRLLSNLETEKEKLLQIILVGQLELEAKLRSTDLKQLEQRITIRYRLKHLSQKDTRAYILHRLRIASKGGETEAHFTTRVLKDIYTLSSGIPRLINIICERSLMAAFVEGKKTIDKFQTKKALESIKGEQRVQPTKLLARQTPGMLVVLLVVICASTAGYRYLPSSAGTYPVIPQLQNHQIEVLKESDLLAGQATLNTKKAQLRQQEADLLAKEALLRQQEASLHQKETLLTKKEAGLNEKTLLIAKKQPPPALAQQNITTHVTTVPPSEAFHVPINQSFIAVDRDENRASIWTGRDEILQLKKEFSWQWPLPFEVGLFILGRDEKGAFIFNHQSFFWRNPYELSPNLWQKISEVVAENYVPLVAYSSNAKVNHTMIAQAREIRTIITAWAEALRNLEPDRLIDFYDKVFTAYYMDRDKTKVYTKRQLYRIKKDVLERSGFVSLKISEPLCIVDPGNSKMAVAIFNQKYRSKIHADKGTKIFYFRLVEEPDAKQAWKIVAKLWLPRD